MDNEIDRESPFVRKGSVIVREEEHMAAMYKKYQEASFLNYKTAAGTGKSTS